MKSTLLKATVASFSLAALGILTLILTSCGDARGNTSGISASQIRTAAPGVVNLSGAVAVEGTSQSICRADHVHSLSGVVPVANGGTGSASQNWVDLTTDQTVAGKKVFTASGTNNGITGVGAGGAAPGGQSAGGAFAGSLAGGHGIVGYGTGTGYGGVFTGGPGAFSHGIDGYGGPGGAGGAFLGGSGNSIGAVGTAIGTGNGVVGLGAGSSPPAPLSCGGAFVGAVAGGPGVVAQGTGTGGGILALNANGSSAQLAGAAATGAAGNFASGSPLYYGIAVGAAGGILGNTTGGVGAYINGGPGYGVGNSAGGVGVVILGGTSYGNGAAGDALQLTAGSTQGTGAGGAALRVHGANGAVVSTTPAAIFDNPGNSNGEAAQFSMNAVAPLFGNILLTPGTVDPSAPLNGDVWATSNGLFAQVHGAKVGMVTFVRGVAICATAAAAGATCTTTLSWPVAFNNTSYTATCVGDGVTSGVPLNGGLTAKAVGSITFQTVAATAAAAQYAALDCIAVHD